MSHHHNKSRIRRPRPFRPQTHPDEPLSNCTICGAPCYPSFFFDIHDNMTCLAHPSCVMMTSPWVFGEDRPSRPVEKGQRVLQTCLNPTCINPDHLEVVG